jgi:hypothetical protein
MKEEVKEVEEEKIKEEIKEIKTYKYVKDDKWILVFDISFFLNLVFY